jgi:hypothetical protein
MDVEPEIKKEEDSIDRDPDICSERNYLMRDEGNRHNYVYLPLLYIKLRAALVINFPNNFYK